MRSSRLRPTAIMTVCIGGTVVTMMPVFLLGSLAGEVSDSLNLAESGIGVLVAGFFGVSALLSIPGGAVVRRTGWPIGLGAACLAVAAATLVIGSAGSGVALFAVGLTIAAAGNALCQPAANLGIVRSFWSDRKGAAFGLKQAAIPVSTLLAAVALPSIAVRFGWRVPYLALAALAVIMAVLALSLGGRVDAGRSVAGQEHHTDRPRDRKLWLLSLGGGFGTAAANSIGAFIVLHALNVGLSPFAAGALLAAGSVTNIVTRIVSGIRADHRVGGHLVLVSRMMLLGSVGVLLLALVPNTVALWVGALAAFGVGWGWNGLLHLGTMELFSSAAASVTGFVQVFLFSGAVLGPLVFGFVAEHASYTLAWTVTAGWLLCSSGLVHAFNKTQASRVLAVSPHGPGGVTAKYPEG